MAIAHPTHPTSAALTFEAQQAMAEYEASRIHYREVVLASLDGRTEGAAIRAAIDRARDAYAALERCRPSGTSASLAADARCAPSRWALLRAHVVRGARRGLFRARSPE